jgi:hypothetical protein
MPQALKAAAAIHLSDGLVINGIFSLLAQEQFEAPLEVRIDFHSTEHFSIPQGITIGGPYAASRMRGDNLSEIVSVLSSIVTAM